MLGFLSQDELTAELLGAKALVAPSLGGESFGMVLTRAFACATPVVASDISGYRGVMEPEAGLLVPPGDPSALAEAVISLLADEQRRRSSGAPHARSHRSATRGTASRSGSSEIYERPGRVAQGCCGVRLSKTPLGSGSALIVLVFAGDGRALRLATARTGTSSPTPSGSSPGSGSWPRLPSTSSRSSRGRRAWQRVIEQAMPPPTPSFARSSPRSGSVSSRTRCCPAGSGSWRGSAC